VTRTFLVGLCASLLLAAAACSGEEEKPAPGNQVDSIAGATADIVFQCRSVQSGFLSTVNEEAVDRDVEALTEAAEEFDLDATFRLPPPAFEPETTLRDQIELAVTRLEDDCSPEHAEQLRAVLED
jgi:hypothetical protein